MDTKNKERGVVPVLALAFLGFLGTTGLTAYFAPRLIELAGKNVVLAAGVIIHSLVAMLFGWAANLFDLVATSDFLQTAITKEKIVMDGWIFVRDFSNMFVVLGFVVVGIATILRIREYEAQKLLPKLIIVALLINFSLLICGIVIDGTNITMNFFFTGQNAVGGQTITAPLRNSVMDLGLTATFDQYKNEPDIVKALQLATASSLYAGIAAMLLIIYSVLFLFRQVALMCLVILSPLAFVASVFPRTNAIYNKWLTQFVQWAIIGIPSAFFLYLGGQMAVIYRTGMVGAGKGDLSYWVPVAFMYFAYTLIFQISAIGAAGAIGLATGAMGFAAGYGKKGGAALGKGLAGASGATALARATRNQFSAIGEKMGLVSKGTTAQRLEEGQKKASSRIDLLSKAQQAKLATGWAHTAEQRDNKRAAIRALVSSGNADEFKTQTEREKALAFVASGSSKSKDEIAKDFAKQDYRFAGHDTKRVRKYMDDFGVGEAAAQTGVKQEQLETNWNSMPAGARKNVDIGDLSSEFVMKKNGSDFNAFRELPATHATRAHLKAMAAPLGPVEIALNAAVAAVDTSEIRRLTTLRQKLLAL